MVVTALSQFLRVLLITHWPQQRYLGLDAHMKCCEIGICADMQTMKGSYLWRVDVDCLERKKEICSALFYFRCTF